MDFAGKRVLVTGAGRGIGAGVARMLATQGAAVAVHYNQSASAAADVLASLAGSGHALVQADLSQRDAARGMIEATAEQLGGLDILINNAGIYTEHPVLSADYDDWMAQWDAIIQTNLISSADAIYWAVRVMTDGGAIVNVSSRGAFRGEPFSPAYGASKAGMNSMGQSLAVALAPRRIHVISVAPGWVDTDMATEHLDGPAGDAIRAQSPYGRVATVEEVANVVVFAASDKAKFMTGAILDVNGASYLRT